MSHFRLQLRGFLVCRKQQWINYGDRGSGVCVEFEKEKLFELIREGLDSQDSLDSDLYYYFYPIVYCDSDYSFILNKFNLFSETIQDYYYQIHLIHEKSNLKERIIINEEIRQISIMIASLIKSHFHKDEKEWRFLILTRNKNNKKVDIVENGSRLRSVYKLPIKEGNILNVINSIMLGPKLSNDQVSLSTLKLMVSKWQNNAVVEIKPSDGLISRNDY